MAGNGIGSISSAEARTFDALFSGEYDGRLALARCYLDGEPTTCICMLDRDHETGDFLMTPLYVAVTASMDLCGPDGASLESLPGH